MIYKASKRENRLATEVTLLLDTFFFFYKIYHLKSHKWVKSLGTEWLNQRFYFQKLCLKSELHLFFIPSFTMHDGDSRCAERLCSNPLKSLVVILKFHKIPNYLTIKSVLNQQQQLENQKLNQISRKDKGINERLKWTLLKVHLLAFSVLPQQTVCWVVMEIA